MDRIISAERGEELPGFELQVVGKVCSLKERFLNFHFGLVVVTKFEDDVGEAFEVRIDCTVEGELDVTRVEPALLRVVIANFDMVEVACAVGISCGGLVEGRAPSRPSLGPDVTEGVPPFSRSDGAVGFAFSIAAC